MRIEQAISHATVICFNVSQIKRCLAQKLNEGMVTFQVAESKDSSESQVKPMNARPQMNIQSEMTDILISRASNE